MRVGELSKILGVPQALLNRLARLGVIPAKRFRYRGAHWRFAESNVDEIREALMQGGMIETPGAATGDACDGKS